MSLKQEAITNLAKRIFFDNKMCFIELTKIYSEIRPCGLTDRALQSIEDVTNPFLNSINEKCARIRGAFVGQFDDHMARHYYIDGLRGKAKKVSLLRDLVVWENG